MTAPAKALSDRLIEIINEKTPIVSGDSTFDGLMAFIEKSPISSGTFAKMQQLFAQPGYGEAALMKLQTALLGKESKKIQYTTVEVADKYLKDMGAPFVDFLFSHPDFLGYKLFVILHQYRLSDAEVARFSPDLLAKMDHVANDVGIKVGSDKAEAISVGTEMRNLHARVPAINSPNGPPPVVPSRPAATQPEGPLPVVPPRPAATPVIIPGSSGAPVVVMPQQPSESQPFTAVIRQDNDQMIVSVREKALQLPKWDAVKKSAVYRKVDCDALEIDGSFLAPKCLLRYFSDDQLFEDAKAACSDPIKRYLDSLRLSAEGGRKLPDSFSLVSLFNVIMKDRSHPQYKELYSKLYSFAMCCFDLFLTEVQSNQGKPTDYVPLAKRLQGFFLQVDDFITKYTSRNSIRAADDMNNELHIGNNALLTAYMVVSFITIGKSLDKSIMAYVNKASSLVSRAKKAGDEAPQVTALEESTREIARGKEQYDEMRQYLISVTKSLLESSHPDFRNQFERPIMALLSE